MAEVKWLVVEGDRLSEHEKIFFNSIPVIFTDPFVFSERLAREYTGMFVKLADKADVLFYQKLLKTRLSRETCAKPFLFWGARHDFLNSPLWPTISNDAVLSAWNAEDVSKWMNNVISFKPSSFNSLWGSCFEVITQAVQLDDRVNLVFIRTDGAKGGILVERGNVIQCCTEKLTGKKALFDMLTWSEGSCQLQPKASLYDSNSLINQPLWNLFDEYYKQIEEVVFIFSLIQSFNVSFYLEENNCALDDAGDPNYEGHKVICSLIQEGKTLNQILALSPLNTPDTIAYIYRLLSFGDIVEAERKDFNYNQSTSEPFVLATVQPLKKIKVLVADDAPFFQKVLTRILSRDGRFEIVGNAKDGLECLELTEKTNPDVLSLDIEMPRLDGLGTLKRLMIKSPKPVVVLSAFTGETSRQTYEAFKLGAVDVVKKPSKFSVEEVEKQEKLIAERIYRVAGVKLDAIKYVRKRRAGANSGEKALNFKNRFLIFSYFGEGSFSLFLRTLAYLNGVNLSAPVICVVPVKQVILDSLFHYISQDFELPIVKPDMKMRMSVNSPNIFLVGSDVRIHFFEDNNRLSFLPFEDDGVPLEDIIDSLCKTAIDARYELLFTAISGRRSASVPFIKAATPGWKVAYLDPAMCLFPDLGLELKKNSIGFEFGSIKEMVQCMIEPEKIFNDIKNSLSESVGHVTRRNQ